MIGFTLAYSAHTAELMGFYTWIVAFLTFSQAGINSGDLTSFLAVGTIASTVTLLAVPASIFGNEAARRFGRLKVLRAVMYGSAVVATILRIFVNTSISFGFANHCDLWGFCSSRFSSYYCRSG